MIATRQREIAASLARRPWVEPRARASRGPRRPARVAVGMRLIGIGLRLVDPGGNLPLGHDLA
jgi:hypothetical protein